MGDRSSLISNLEISLIVVSTFIIIVRLYVRLVMIKSAGLDDVLAGMAFVMLLANASIELEMVKHGSGHQMSSVSPLDLKEFFALFPTAKLIYFIAIGLVRLSVCAFIPRLSKESKIKYITWGLGAAIAIQTIVSFFVVLFECRPVKALWDGSIEGAVCMPKSREAILMYAHGGIGILFDILLIAIPIWIIHDKMMWNATMVKVILVFSVGIFSCITGIIRLVQIVQINMAVNTTYNITYASVWSNLEGHTGLWVASFPALQPLLRLVSYKLGWRSKINSTSPHELSNTYTVRSYARYLTRSKHARINSKSGRLRSTISGENASEEHIIGTETTVELKELVGSENDKAGGPSKGIVKTTEVQQSSGPRNPEWNDDDGKPWAAV